MPANPCGQGGGERRRRRWADAGFSVVLVALVWTAYWSSLRHTPRSDHWCFLLDTIDRRDFADILAHTYSYNRTRLVCPGDADLFRPLLFALLAAEKALFGTHFWPSQAVGIALHCCVCLLLLALLRHVAALRVERPGAGGAPPGLLASLVAELLPYGVVLFFALNFSIQELVIWSHLHGYLLFLALVLGSLILLLRCVRRAEAPGGGGRLALAGAWALALLSAFTYELGQVYAVLAGLFLAGSLHRRLGVRRSAVLAAAFGAILILYQTANVIDFLSHRGCFPEEHNGEKVMRSLLTADSLTNSARFVVFTTFQPFFPSQTRHWFGADRLGLTEWAWDGDLPGPSSPGAVLSWLVVGLAAALALAGLGRMARRRQTALIMVFFVAFGLYGAYVAANALGRMNLRPDPSYLGLNSYYVYPALLFALTAGGAAWEALGRTGRLAVCGRGALLLGLAVLSLTGAAGVRQVNRELAGCMKGLRQSTQALNRFVERHRGEPDFSLGIDYDASDPDGACGGVPLTTILFKRWMTAAEPKYVVALRDGAVIVLRDPPADRLSAKPGKRSRRSDRSAPPPGAAR